MREYGLGRLRPGLAVACLGLALLACGGGDDAGGTPASGTSPTDAEGTVASVPPSAEEGGGDDQPVAGGSITWLTPGEATSYDPLASGNPNGFGSAASLVQAVYDQLIRVEADGTITPRLAEAVSGSDDFRTWTVELRTGLEFTDGTPLDADAVIANWERHAKPENGSRCFTSRAAVQEVERTSPTTLTAVLGAPNAQFPIQLAGCLGLLASPTAMDTFGAEYGSTADKTVGAGPFKLESWTPNAETVLVRNDTFWDSPRPYLDRLVVRPVEADPQQRAQAFLAGEADMATFNISTPAFNTLDAAGFDPVTESVYGGQGFAFNVREAPLDDARVRRALLLAIDTNVLNDQGFAGTAGRPDTFFPDDLPYFDPALTWLEPDLMEAQALIDEYLAETGGSIDLTLLAQAGPLEPLAISVQQQVSRLKGVNFEVDLVPSSEIGAAWAQHSFELVTYVLSARNPYPEFYDQFRSDSVLNISGINDQSIDEALNSAMSTDDAEELNELYRTVARTLIDESYVGIVMGSHLRVYKTDQVGGLEFHSFAIPDLAEVYVAQ